MHNFRFPFDLISSMGDFKFYICFLTTTNEYFNINDEDELAKFKTTSSGDQESINQGQVSELPLDGLDLIILPTA